MNTPHLTFKLKKQQQLTISNSEFKVKYSIKVIKVNNKIKLPIAFLLKYFLVLIEIGFGESKD